MDIIHSNDHHTALVPVYMRTMFSKEFQKTGSVFTIHNIGYQGNYPEEWLEELGLPEHEIIRRLLIKSGEINLMASVPGVVKILGAKGNYINTVSPTYAEDIRRTYFEIDRLLYDVGNRFGGILNGIDFHLWNPADDKMIARRYEIKGGIEDVMWARKVSKRVLQQCCRRGV